MAYSDQEFFDVESSNVSAVAYSFDDYIMYLRFHNGSVYGYSGIEPELYEDFLAAPSKGQWVWQVLRRGGYEFWREV